MAVTTGNGRRSGAKPKKPQPTTLDQLAQMAADEAAPAVKQGLPAELARQLSERLEAPLEVLAKSLQLTLRTLHRRMQEGRLALPESERLLAITRIFFLAVHTLDSEAKAVHWLKSPLRALAGQTPLEAVETWPGIRQVEETLGRIEGGVYS